MGGGGGVIIEKIGLAQYQASRGGELTVEVNDGVNTYTWVAGGEYTVSDNFEIIFEETDRMVIPEDTSVTLEGIFNISETTDNFTRIENDGTLIIAEGAEIEFGTITGDTDGGGDAGGGVGIKTTSSESTYIYGKITFNKLQGDCAGLDNQGGTVTLETRGRLIYKKHARR